MTRDLRDPKDLEEWTALKAKLDLWDPLDQKDPLDLGETVESQAVPEAMDRRGLRDHVENKDLLAREE